MSVFETEPTASSAFKYQPEFDRLGLKDCPPTDYLEVDMLSYRFVFSDLANQDNFRPVFMIHPKRVNANLAVAVKCQGFGLSLYEVKNEAVANFQRWMAKTRGEFANHVGTHLATVELKPEDGIGNEPDLKNFTHFTFHEYTHADLSKRIRQVDKI